MRDGIPRPSSKQAAERSRQVGDERWATTSAGIRSYVVQEENGSLGTICRLPGHQRREGRGTRHLLGLPADEVMTVLDTVLRQGRSDINSAFLSGKEAEMAKQVDCPCGETIRGDSDDELVSNVEAHVQLGPSRHGREDVPEQLMAQTAVTGHQPERKTAEAG